MTEQNWNQRLDETTRHDTSIQISDLYTLSNFRSLNGQARTENEIAASARGFIEMTPVPPDAHGGPLAPDMVRSPNKYNADDVRRDTARPRNEPTRDVRQSDGSIAHYDANGRQTGVTLPDGTGVYQNPVTGRLAPGFSI